MTLVFLSMRMDIVGLQPCREFGVLPPPERGRVGVGVKRGSRFDRIKTNTACARGGAAMRPTWKDGRGKNRELHKSMRQAFAGSPMRCRLTPTRCPMTPTPTLPLSGGGGAPSAWRGPGSIGIIDLTSNRRVGAPAPGGGHLDRLQLGNLQGNDFEHAGKMLCDVGIPESKHSHAALGEPCIALTVPTRGLRMLPAVELRGDLQCRAIEIQDGIARGMLATKSCAIDLRVSQFLPQPPFDISCVTAQPARALGLNFSAIETRTDADPCALLRDPHPDPPPFRGRGRTECVARSRVNRHHQPPSTAFTKSRAA